MPTLDYLAIAAYAAGLLVTLTLAAWFTPARWWRRPNVRALAILAGGTWGLGTLMLGMVQTPAVAQTPSPQQIATLPATAPSALALPAAGRSYHVHEDLNLRAGTGTGARRITVVPAGTVVTTTGLRDGDWWQVHARVRGREVSGWSSSLWLRRADERRP